MPQTIAGAIGLLLFKAGAPLAVASFAVSAAGAAIVSTAIGVGLSLAASALLKPKAPAAIKPSDGQQEIKLEVAPRIRSMGTVRIAGARWWGETDPANPRVLYVGTALNHGRIGSIIDHRIDEKAVQIDGNGLVSTEPYADGGGANQVTIGLRLGASAETEHSDIDTVFDVADARGDGVATVLVRYRSFDNPTLQLDVYPNGIPTYLATIDGSAVFDPRETSHDREIEATWEASENPVVHLFHFCFIDADGYGMGYARVADNLAEWTAAMDACDVAVARKTGGSEARYRVAGTYFLTDDPRDVAARILSTCDGKMWPRRDGQIGISVGVFSPPTVTIASKDIVGYEVQRGPDRLVRAAGIRAEYMSPLHEYHEQDAEPWPNGETVLNLGEERTVSLDLTWSPSHGQARRLMKRHSVRMNSGWRLTVTTNLAGLRAIDERFVHLTIAEIGIDESFEVNGFTLDPSSLQVTMELIAVAASIDDWNAATEEGDLPALSPLTETEIDPDDHTPIGDMTAVGLFRAFDGITNEGSGDSARKNSTTDAFIGLSLATPRRVKRAVVYGSNNEGFCDAAANITLTLRAKTGAAPALASEGTLLGSLAAFADTSNESGGRAIPSTDLLSEWDHVWSRIQSSATGDLFCAEMVLFE